MCWVSHRFALELVGCKPTYANADDTAFRAQTHGIAVQSKHYDEARRRAANWHTTCPIRCKSL
ncbi:hypothetical protein BN2475_50262 [Paraburkholderia ribeironis]|uniref:Uncharacterized protein n=1 Tax=Paraburkholderia ribeironis TaxID=1247936 RepID=A0A1N7RL54_9BURK|nr:hypothetical protein BN2475_50262 [Paraburkholderia ribeironis]